MSSAETIEPRPPVILIGMHRSGTTLVARLLRDLGLFLGERRQQDEEALFFRRLNDLFFLQSGGAWDHPAALDALLRDEPVRRLAVEHAREQLGSPQAAGFLGLGRYVRLRSLARLRDPWGWKDPRNTFTLPLWLELFPESRVVHVLRHGVDVAASLVERRSRNLASAAALHRRRRRMYGLRHKRKPFVTSVRCATVEESFALWEEYADRAGEHTRALGSRALVVRFEELVATPEPVLGELARFSGLGAVPSALAEAATVVRGERAFAFFARPELRAFAESVEERLGRRGYSSAGSAVRER